VPNVALTRLARRDLDDIWLSVAEDNLAAADHIVDGLTARMELLERFPDLGPARPDFGPGLRALVEGKYLVVYKRGPNEVEIVRVLHGARNFSELL
jgi:toxin ParE1/3/4